MPLFAGVFLLFSALQTPTGYRMLGSPPTYVHTPEGIRGARKPYASLNQENMAHWDAVFYKVIKEEGYTSEGRLHPHKQAFFPLFSLIWRLSGVDDRYSEVLSWLLFALGLFLPASAFDASPETVALLILFPPAFVFLIPYSEGATFLAVAVGVWGALKEKKAVAVAGFFAAGMSRPAILFLPLALMTVEALRFRRKSIVHLCLYALPVLLGFACVLMMMRHESGVWFGPFAAQKMWQSGQFSWKVRDRSHEGFFMSVPALIFVGLPCLLGLPGRLFGRLVPEPNTPRYWTLISAVTTVLAASAWYKNEGCFNGLSRYMLATPFFYVLALATARRLRHALSWDKRAAFWTTATGATIVFIAVSGYTRPLQFQILGAALMFAAFFYLLFRVKSKWFWIFYAPAALFWHAHIFNMFLRNAWIVT